MAKILKQIGMICFLHLIACSTGTPLLAQEKYRLLIHAADKSPEFVMDTIRLTTVFAGRQQCSAYIETLPALLQAQGYVSASVDSIHYDTTFAHLFLYFGRPYHWKYLGVQLVDPQLLAVSGWQKNKFDGRPLSFDAISDMQKRMLRWLENNGYPFAKIYLDSLQLHDDSISALLIAEKGPLYKIDSLRIFGNAKISGLFIQRYLDVGNGSIFSRQKLEAISGRIRELGFVEEEQPHNLSMLGTGSVLNLYLKQKRSSQINFLIGFLPNNDQLSSKKLLVTGEANIHLRNALGAGETIGLNWQQIQVKSPRLNILFRYPYLFNSPFGFDFSFDMFRKDSSFLNVNLQLGTVFQLLKNQSGKIFFQRFQTIISEGGFNRNSVIQTRRLPDVADVSSSNIGIEYTLNKTNYRLNPKQGFDLGITAAAGKKKIKKNNEILELKDPGDPSFDFGALYDTLKLNTYQFRAFGHIAKYFPSGRQSTFRTVLSGGLFLSDNIFRNELFQIGGFKLLRGFDEESQYVSQYAVASLEYRYLIGLNSYFYVFSDGGWAANRNQNITISHSYISGGIGLALETKNSIFNLAWAVGKRDDSQFNLRQSKIHFGFVNYF